MLWTLQVKVLNLSTSFAKQFLYMDFEMIEMFIICYIGNWNMMSFSFENTSMQTLTPCDL
jgi:hypothetical protein